MFTAYLSLAVFLLLVIIASLVGAGFEAGEWFHVTIIQPSWTPPYWLFGQVWTLLYVLMALAAWMVWLTGGPGGLDGLADRPLFTQPGLDLVDPSAAVKCGLVVPDFWFTPAGLGAAIAWPHDWYRDILHQGIQPFVQAGCFADDALPGVDCLPVGVQFLDLGLEWWSVIRELNSLLRFRLCHAEHVELIAIEVAEITGVEPIHSRAGRAFVFGAQFDRLVVDLVHHFV